MGCCQIGDKKVLSTATSAPAACAASRDRPNVDYPKQRIAGCLDPYQHRLGFEGRAQLSRLALIDEIHDQISLRMQCREQAMRAAVAIVRREHARPGRQSRQDQGDGGQPGARDNCAGAAFQVRQRAAELVARRIAGAGVIVLARLPIALKCKIRRQVNRRHHGAVVRVGLDAGANRSSRDILGRHFVLMAAAPQGRA